MGASNGMATVVPIPNGPRGAEFRVHDMSLLLIDDDKSLLQRLARGMQAHGYDVQTAETAAAAEIRADARPPAFVVVDLKLVDGNGLDVIAGIRARRPDCRALVLTGYGNIATAVAAIKLGAVDYLTKPSDADDVHQALMQVSATMPAVPAKPMSADRVRWEHIHHIYESCQRNVSETARRLTMHRRTLQRILAKRAPR